MPRRGGRVVEEQPRMAMVVIPNQNGFLMVEVPIHSLPTIHVNQSHLRNWVAETKESLANVLTEVLENPRATEVQNMDLIEDEEL